MRTWANQRWPHCVMDAILGAFLSMHRKPKKVLYQQCIKAAVMHHLMHSGRKNTLKIPGYSAIFEWSDFEC